MSDPEQHETSFMDISMDNELAGTERTATDATCREYSENAMDISNASSEYFDVSVRDLISEEVAMVSKMYQQQEIGVHSYLTADASAISSSSSSSGSATEQVLSSYGILQSQIAAHSDDPTNTVYLSSVSLVGASSGDWQDLAAHQLDVRNTLAALGAEYDSQPQTYFSLRNTDNDLTARRRTSTTSQDSPKR